MAGSLVIQVHPLPETSSGIFTSTEDPSKRPHYEEPWQPLINYDQAETKSAQELLYEAVRELDQEKSLIKWEKFMTKTDDDQMSPRKVRNIISTLDDENHWAALHYAVESNNLLLCKKLTSKKELYHCDFNILGGNGENVLHVAAFSNHMWRDNSTCDLALELIKFIINESKGKANVNQADNEDRTPLHLAVMKNRYHYAEYLISCKADLTALSKLNANVLHFAVIPGGRQSITDLCSMIQLITDNLPKISDLFKHRTIDDQTPLVFLASHPTLNQTKQFPEAVEDLMKKFTEAIEKDQKQILRAFDMVARRRQLKEFNHLKLLVDQSSDRTREQMSYLACRCDNVALLDWILKHVNNTSDYAGFTLLTATFYNAEECVKYLLEMNTNQPSKISVEALYCKSEDLDRANILHICAKRQVSESLSKEILEKLDDKIFYKLMQSRDSEDNLPLHLAASWNLPVSNTQRAMKARDNKGNIVLHITSDSNEDKSCICEQLLRRMKEMSSSYNSSISQRTGSIVLDVLSTKNRLGKTPIHEASQKNHKGNLKLMWEALSADDKKNREKGFFMYDNSRFTCVHLAAKNGNHEVLKFLIETVHMEADVIGDRRLTPLHLACQFGHLDAVKYLINQKASITIRNAQLCNCLEISIMEQHEEIVKYLFSLLNWREMMRNAQRIKSTEAFDTPMRKLIRYMPNVTLWMIEEKLIRRVGGEEQKICKEIYDYEFYEDMYRVKQWYAQSVKLPEDDMSCGARWRRLGVNAIFGCCCTSCHQVADEQNGFTYQPYTRDAYTRVRNHPLLLVSQQSGNPDLMEHAFHVLLRKKMYRRFGTYWLAFSFVFYIILVGVWTTVVLNGKHPQYFYERVNLNMTMDIDTCERVANALVSQNITEAFKTVEYRRLKFAIYALFLVAITKNSVIVIALFPKIFRTGAYYLEASALVLSFVYIFDWYDWQNPIVFRCPIQYQIGAMGILLSWINLLTYVRCIPWLNIGIYVAMIQVIFFKFLRFLPVLMIIICGFGFAYWMLLQNQTVFASPIEALIRTSLMTFDLGYESRIYGTPDQPVYYKLVYVIIIFTAVVFCIFIINLMIGLAVGEIPSLVVQGTLWRSQMLYNLLSDYEILRLQLCRFSNFMTCYQTEKIKRIRRRPILLLTHDKMSHCLLCRMWFYTKKHFLDEQIQDNVRPKPGNKKVDKGENET